MKVKLILLLYLFTIDIYSAGDCATGENCPLPTGASNNFTGDPCQLATLNQSGSFIGSSTCPCTLVGLDKTTLTTKLTQESKLINCDLTNADLSNLNLTGVDFTGSTLTGANLSGCILDGASFQNAKDMSSIKLINIRSANNAKFNNSPLYGAVLSGNFSGAIFDGVGLAGANLDNSNFTGASFLNLTPWIGSNTQFTDSNGQIVQIQAYDPLDLTGSVLNNVNFSNAKLNGIQFTNCVLNNVTFNDQTDFSLSAGSQVKTSFKQVNSADILKNNKLSISSLANPTINFNNANLSNVDFSNADFTQTNATEANFTGANLDGAVLAGNFTNANFTNANFTNNTTIANGNFTGATLNTNVAVYGAFFPLPACVTKNTPGDFVSVINKAPLTSGSSQISQDMQQLSQLMGNSNNASKNSSAITMLLLKTMGDFASEIGQYIGAPYVSFYSRLVEICTSSSGACQTQFCTVGGCKCP